MKKVIKLRPKRQIALQPFEASLPAAFPALGSDAPVMTRTATLSEWLRHWLEDAIAPRRELTTVYGYRRIIDNHLIPALGRVRLCDLTPGLIQSYYRWVADSKHLSSNTVRKHHILLHTALQLAYRQGLLPSNPVDRVEPPRLLAPRQSFYNPEQLARLLKRVEGGTLELPVKLACFLGLRRSEIAGLRWCDVDLESCTLSVRHVRTAVGPQVVCKAPKSAGSMRTLDLTPVGGLVTLLRRRKEEDRALLESQGRPWDETVCVLLDPEGAPFHPDRLSSAFSRFLRDHGLPKVTLHGLRHTFASVANDARVPMFQISKALGHSDPAITARVYTHLFDQTHGDVLSAVAAAIPAYSAAVDKDDKF